VGERLLGGWQLGGILTLQNGFPATLTITNRLSSLGIRQELPDLAPGAGNNPSRPGNPDQYFDPNAFLWPATRTLGNLGRNTLTIPGLATVDFSLAKEFKVRETSGLQFRFEAFNFFNHPNFGAPDRNIFDRNGVRNSTAGRITNTVTTARQIQLALKYIF
jgi:hypothetical protein